MKTLLAFMALMAMFVTGTFGSGCDVQWTTTGTLSFLKHPQPPAPLTRPQCEQVQPEKPCEPAPRPTFEVRSQPIRPGFTRANCGDPVLIRYPSAAPAGWEIYQDRRPAVAWIYR